MVMTPRDVLYVNQTILLGVTRIMPVVIVLMVGAVLPFATIANQLTFKESTIVGIKVNVVVI